jgi:hypothetical protein
VEVLFDFSASQYFYDYFKYLSMFAVLILVFPSRIYMTDSTTQSASPLVKIYHGFENIPMPIPVGLRFEP